MVCSPGCNHTYSEHGIRSHLQRSKKCPVAGCPHKLTLEGLERDVEMEVLIARRYVRRTNAHAVVPYLFGSGLYTNVDTNGCVQQTTRLAAPAAAAGADPLVDAPL